MSHTNKITHTTHDLLQIKSILEKTRLPETIIYDIVEDFINTNTKCKMCCKKHETFKICEKCKSNYCQNCILEKEFKKQHFLCKKCYPSITDIHDLYKNICDTCTSYDNEGEDYRKCEICNKIVCPDCHFIRYCTECFDTLDTDLIDISNEENYFRCDNCLSIEYADSHYRCISCDDYFCGNCVNECSKCDDPICENCTNKCEYCQNPMCDQCCHHIS